MADRDRTGSDSDLEFDFFGEPEGSGAPPVAPPPPKGAGKPPVRPRAPGQGTPLLRLALLIGGAIILAVVLVLWVNSCREGQKTGAYEDYFQAVGAVVQESNNVGRQLTDVLTTPGVTLDDIGKQLDGLARQQAQVVNRADQLSSPGALVDEQDSLVESMQLLQSGLAGLGQAFDQLQLAAEPEEAGATLAGQAGRLIAGEVVYDDLFKARSEEVMKQEEVSGVPVPELRFLTNPELIGQGSLGELVQRLTQTPGGAAGLHGNQLVGVQTLPDGTTLSASEENTVVASDQLAFQVSIRNSGDFQETRLKVVLTIRQNPQIRKTATIEVINAGQTRVVTFRDFSNVVFATKTTLRVAVQPVEGENNLANNSAEYPVIFTLE